jgi:hypothetical protein
MLNMTPTFAMNDTPNRTLGYIHALANFFLRFARGTTAPNLKNVSGGEFSHSVALAARCSSVTNGVGTVVALGIPSEIRKSVVAWIAIVMTALHAFWAWANKRFKNETMDPQRFRNATLHKADGAVSVFFGMSRMFALPRGANDPAATVSLATANLAPATPYGAIAANHVTGKVVDGTELDSRIVLRHDTLLESGLC